MSTAFSLKGDENCHNCDCEAPEQIHRDQGIRFHFHFKCSVCDKMFCWYCAESKVVEPDGVPGGDPVKTIQCPGCHHHLTPNHKICQLTMI